MKSKIGFKRRGLGYHAWRVGVILIACAIIYYLPDIAGIIGGAPVRTVLNRLHDFYGLDMYALAFFVPVVYAAYVVGVIGAVVAALVAMLPLLYHELVVADYPSIMFRPTAFVIILSAVGAAIAMIQKNDIQRERSLLELKCLYDVGKASKESSSLNDFAKSLVNIIRQNTYFARESMVRVSIRGESYETPGFIGTGNIFKEELVGGGEVVGSMEILCTGNSSYLRRNQWVKALAERIGSAVHEIDLEQSVENYYEQLEDMVEKRTRELEQTQEKLIRSERLAAVGELASGVGHELRNPLNVMRNGVYLLNMSLDGNATEEIGDILKLIDRQVDSVNRIVTDLLDFTRVVPPQKTQVNINKLVQESLSWIAMPPNVAVKTEFDASKPEIIADGEQIGRAFANIVSNAIQAMHDGGELRITTGIQNGYAFARFEDTGDGITSDNMNRIFEPLFTTKPRGIGLGLAITKRLVNQNGGSIEVKSEVGKGTAFTLSLPRQKGDDKSENKDKNSGG